MTPEDDLPVERISLNLEDEDDYEELLRPRVARWAIHRCETYALAAVLIAVGTLVGGGTVQDLQQAVLFSSHGPKTFLNVGAGLHLGLGVLAFVLAALAISAEDEDSTWSPPVARAAAIVAVIVIGLAVATLIIAGQ